MLTGGGWFWYASGATIWRQDYYAFGSDYGTIATGNTHKFTGHVQDTTTGQYYAKARYFTAQNGRWTQPEPLLKGVPPRVALLSPQYLNPYVYSLNNPLKYTDPNGLWSIKVELSQNRDKPGSLIIFDRKGKEVGKYSALGRGSDSPKNDKNHKNRLKENADTPTEKYAIIRKEDTKDWNQRSYGPNGGLRFDPIAGRRAGS